MLEVELALGAQGVGVAERGCSLATGRGLRAGVLDVFQKGLFWGVVAGRLGVLSSVILRFDESVLMGSVVYEAS